MNPTQSAAATVTEDRPEEWALVLRSDITTALADLGADVDLVVSLTDSHQRGLGFLTPTAKQVLDDQVRKERRDRREQPRRLDDHGRPVVGLNWLNRTATAAGTGEITSPGNFRAITSLAEIWAALTHQVRRCVRHLATQRVCTLHRLPEHADVPDLLAHLGRLVDDIDDVDLLESILTDLADVHEQATNLIDGNPKAAHPDPCPWCGRHTLVVYFREDLIRCDRDPGTGHYQPCVCRYPWCDCKRRPVSHRHTWHRTRATSADGWYGLKDQIKHAETSTEDPEGSPS